MGRADLVVGTVEGWPDRGGGPEAPGGAEGGAGPSAAPAGGGSSRQGRT